MLVSAGLSLVFVKPDSMTPFDLYFRTIFGGGCLLATVVSLIAAGRRGLKAVAILSAAIGIFWFSLFLGADLGYRAWQSVPNPPKAAFADSMPAGALFMGWIPGTVFCVIVFVCGRIFGGLLNWTPGRVQRRQHQGGMTGSVDPANPYVADAAASNHSADVDNRRSSE